MSERGNMEPIIYFVALGLAAVFFTAFLVWNANTGIRAALSEAIDFSNPMVLFIIGFVVFVAVGSYFIARARK